jgi:hypothetical protein
MNSRRNENVKGIRGRQVKVPNQVAADLGVPWIRPRFGTLVVGIGFAVSLDLFG